MFPGAEKVHAFAVFGVAQHLGLTLAWVGVTLWPPSAATAFCAFFAAAAVAAVAAVVGVQAVAVPDAHALGDPLLVSS